jgi:hypothetical protein
MSTIRCCVTRDGEVAHDETFVNDRREVAAVGDPGFQVMGSQIAVTFEFDPPLLTPAAAAGAEGDGWAESDEHEPGTMHWLGGVMTVEPDGAIVESGLAELTPEAAERRAVAYAQAAQLARRRTAAASPEKEASDHA